MYMNLSAPFQLKSSGSLVSPRVTSASGYKTTSVYDTLPEIDEAFQEGVRDTKMPPRERSYLFILIFVWHVKHLPPSRIDVLLFAFVFMVSGQGTEVNESRRVERGWTLLASSGGKRPSQ